MEIIPIPADSYTLGFIGAGKMAESIAKGAVRSGVLSPSRIKTAIHSNPARRTAFESIGITVLSSNDDVVRDSNVVVFSVKPQLCISLFQNFSVVYERSVVVLLMSFVVVVVAVKDVVLKLKPLLTKDKLLVSVAAGIKMKDLQEWAGHERFIRVMPNTAATVGEAASVMSLGGAATEEDANLISQLFGSIGKIWKADDKYFDAITGLSGSGPAYIYLAIEALADGGVAAGLPRDLALSLASQTVLGAASMATQSGKHPGQLKDDVTSPGGTTIAGVHELEKAGFRGILMNAVVAAAKRSQELS
uniref:Pyrroline-5-carboxylate reductase n=1 Tax=Medicago truncatula TaxID=3880 RepID=A2Q2Y7_MEDTR|nr:Delta 1-pyrroline-5-carboxylate reductase; NADP oxidoreductase, coenzyme F420-dependent [Medicago truncatula]